MLIKKKIWPGGNKADLEEKEKYKEKNKNN